MARTATRKLTARPPLLRFPWAELGRPLGAAGRRSSRRLLGRLLDWQRTLRAWPELRGAPDATPFVSLYSAGRLCGCYGSDEGAPGERLARAFLRALDDSRHGGTFPAERDGLAAQVAYLRDARRARSVEDALARLEPGTHGVALVRREGAPALLIPQVARDGALGARGILETLAKKAGVTFGDLSGAGVAIYLFEADELVVRAGDAPGAEERARTRTAVDDAAAWLARIIGKDGAVPFGIDLRARKVVPTGPMHHGRAAMAVRALAAHGGHARVAERAREWLHRDMKTALRGGTVPGWPEDDAVIGGTIALACMAGLPLERELSAFANAVGALDASPWHAAQVVTVLGSAAPQRLWKVCVDALEAKPWAPWTAIAAHALGDLGTLDRAARALEASVRPAPPHLGGASLAGEVPELALTAIVLEALAPLSRASAADAIARARAFLERSQYAAGRIPAPLDEDLAEGAFPMNPVVSFARCDVTAHALLALLQPLPAVRGRARSSGRKQ